MGRPLVGQKAPDPSTGAARPQGDAPLLSEQELEGLLALDGWADVDASFIVIPRWHAPEFLVVEPR